MKTYKFKMYSNHGNRELQKTIDSHAQVWNHFVALCRRYYGIYGNYPGKKALDSSGISLGLTIMTTTLPNFSNGVSTLSNAQTANTHERLKGQTTGNTARLPIKELISIGS